MKIRAILDAKLYEKVPTMKVYAGILNSPRHASRAIKILNEVSPIPSLQHLKRVKKSEGKTFVVVATVPEEKSTEGTSVKRSKPNEDAFLDELKRKGFHPEEFGMCDFEIHDVPAKGPITRMQYEQSMVYWPVNFHPSKKLETFMSESIFEVAEEEYHVANMRRVTEESKAEGKNVALVVDFDKRQHVAKGIDRVELHPLQHAVMVVVDVVAGSRENGGAWALPYDEFSYVKKAPVENISAARCETKEIAAYLCTGYDLYVEKEPCLMCAMCLIHSRVRRVFFRVANPKRGAFVSVCQIHAIRDLNHHFDVFQITE